MNSLAAIFLVGVVIEAIALIFEVSRHGKHSYSAAIGAENAKLREENRLLLDRLLHITTGAPLVLPKDTPVEIDATPSGPSMVEKAKNLIKSVTEAAEKEIDRFPTFAELLQKAEAASFREDAGIEPETGPAAVQAGEEEMTEEQEKQVASLRSKFKEDFARARDEYLSGAKPVFTPAEKRDSAAN